MSIFSLYFFMIQVILGDKSYYSTHKLQSKDFQDEALGSRIKAQETTLGNYFFNEQKVQKIDPFVDVGKFNMLAKNYAYEFEPLIGYYRNLFPNWKSSGKNAGGLLGFDLP